MLQLHQSFSPLCPGFQPEYLGRDIAVLGSIEEETRYLGIGLGSGDMSSPKRRNSPTPKGLTCAFMALDSIRPCQLN